MGELGHAGTNSFTACFCGGNGERNAGVLLPMAFPYSSGPREPSACQPYRNSRYSTASKILSCVFFFRFYVLHAPIRQCESTDLVRAGFLSDRHPCRRLLKRDSQARREKCGSIKNWPSIFHGCLGGVRGTGQFPGRKLRCWAWWTVRGNMDWACLKGV